MDSYPSLANITIDNTTIAVEKMLDLYIEETVGKHAHAMLYAQLKADANINDMLELADQLTIQLGQDDIEQDDIEQEKTPLFTGYIQHIELTTHARVRFIRLSLVGLSSKMDILSHTKRYHNPDRTYKCLFNKLVHAHDGECTDTAFEGEAQTDLAIQYQETDWQFLRRLASRKEAPVYTRMNEPELTVFVGKPDSGPETLNANLLEKTFESNTFVYRVRSVETHPLCSSVTFDDNTYCITTRTIYAHEGILLQTYTLQPPETVTTEKTQNATLAGASLSGTVHDFDPDNGLNYLRIKLDEDEAGAEENEEWFEVATPYSGEGNVGSFGVYIMPSPSARVALYFPQADESLAYVAAVFQSENIPQGILESQANKQWATSGHTLLMNDEQLTLSYKESASLSIKTNDAFSIHSEAAILIKADDLELNKVANLAVTGNEIELKTNSSSILLGRNIDISATAPIRL